MGDIASIALAFAGGCYEAVKAIESLIKNYHQAHIYISSLKESCKTTRRVLRQLKGTLDHGPLSELDDEQRILLASYDRSQSEFDTQLKGYLKELDKFSISKDSKIAKFVSWDRLRVVWRKQYLDNMRRDFLEHRSAIQFLLISLQLLGVIHSSPTRRHSQMSPRQLQEELLVAVSLGIKTQVKTMLDFGANTGICRDFNGVDLTPLHVAAEGGKATLMKLLLSYAADLNALDSGRATPLMRALEMKRWPAALELINLGANVHLANHQGKTALHVAARKNLAAAVKYLLDKKADPKSRDSLGETPLNDALRREGRAEQPTDTSVVQMLLAGGADLCIGRKSTLSTPLHTAATYDMASELSLLVAAAQQAGQRALDLRTLSKVGDDSFGETPLWLAAQNGHSRSAEILLDHGADMSSRCEHPEYPTPLWAALAAGSHEIAHLLLRHLAEPDACDSEGQSILHKKWRNNNEKIIALLLRHGANPQLKDRAGAEPIHHAIREGSVDDVGAAELLLAANASVDAQDGTGMTPLMMAALKGDSDLVMWLLNKHNAKWDLKNNDGCDAFYYAYNLGDILSAAALLARSSGAQINWENRKGNTPLHIAAREGFLEMVRWLLRQRANRTLTSREAFEGLTVTGTAAEIAKEAGHGEVADLIEGFDRCQGAGVWKVEMVAPR